jgi:hypothetical protein
MRRRILTGERQSAKRKFRMVPFPALLALATLWLGVGTSRAQDPLDALRHGQLIVWVVGGVDHPPESNLQAIAALHHATPLTYHEQTSGSFGQNASNYGQDSSNVGVDSSSAVGANGVQLSTPQPAQGQDAPSATPNGVGYKQQESGSFGQTSGGYGTAASNYGTAASNVGQNSASYGTDASRHGQDAGSFGNSTGTIAVEGNQQPPTAKLSHLTEQLVARVKQAFPDLRVRFVEVEPNELKDRLTAAQGTANYPDVLLGKLPASWTRDLQGQFELAMLRPATFYPNGVTQGQPNVGDVAILARAPHMQTAREFALWMNESNADCPGCVQTSLTDKERAAATVAANAMQRVLTGGPLGADADPAIASDLSLGVRRLLTTTGNTVVGDVSPHVEVEHASVDGRLAAVALRVVISSHNVFGVAHPLVVLREDSDGQWRVLHVSLNLPQFEQETLRQALMVTNPPSSEEQRTAVAGVTQAAPQDGTTTTARPELVWDNGGGAGLQVVEWQEGHQGTWSDARLYLVEDRNPRLRSSQIAQFAGANGQYRWRIWSVGAHGEMKISPWRTFNVVK